jgi:hypothetical protein
VKLSLGDIAAADAEVEGPLAGFDGIAGAPPLQLLRLIGEGVPDAFDFSGVVAAEGESGAGKAAFDRRECVLTSQSNVDLAALGHFGCHLVGQLEAVQVSP